MNYQEETQSSWSGDPAIEEWMQRLPAPLLLLDGKGCIRWRNEKWNELAAHYGFPFSQQAPGTSYFEECAARLDSGGQRLSQGLEEFLRTGSRYAEVRLGPEERGAAGNVQIQFFCVPDSAGVLVSISEPEGRKTGSSIAVPYIEATIPWCAVDREGRILSSSESFFQLVDCAPGQLPGTYLWELLPADDRDQYRQLLLQDCAAGQPQAVGQIRLIGRKGRARTFETHSASVTDDAGQFLGLRIGLFDVTDRERAREALAESRDLYRTLAECCGVGVWHVTLGGQTVFVNPAMCDLLEIESPEALKEAAIKEFFSPESMDRIQLEQERRPPGEVSQYEVDLVGKRGTRRRVQITGATLAASNHRFSGFLGIFADITAQHQREVELRQSQKLEAVGRLASGIAHELNTPIQFIGDSIQFLGEAMEEVFRMMEAYRTAVAELPETSEYREKIRRMEREMDLGDLQEQMPKAIERSIKGLQRVAAIVRAMKDFAHPDGGQRDQADLNQALSDTLTITRNEYKYIADVVTDFGTLPPVTCTLSDLNQVFLNLIVNAAHAIAEKANEHSGFHGTITVSTRIEGEQVLITISDTGTGIPAGVRHRIFDPFFTTKPVGRGTGQGLAIAHTVIERHGGTISFTTEVGRGTSFLIRLPIQGSANETTGKSGQ